MSGAVFTMRLFDVLKFTDDIGLSDYPIFEESHRPVLNDKIANHYMYQEIGYETLEMFQFGMSRRMHEVMPLYNQLYESEMLKFDPLVTSKYRETLENASTNKTTETQTALSENASDSDSKARVVSSETPQMMLSGRGDYASGASDTTSNSRTSGTNTTDGSGETIGETAGIVTRESEGLSGSMSQLLREFRSTFLNIDLMIIRELETQFMQVWDAGDQFTYPANPYTFGGQFRYGTLGL